MPKFSNNLSFNFTGLGDHSILRDIVYNRYKGKTYQDSSGKFSIQDEEDCMCTIVNMMERVAEDAYRIGLIIGRSDVSNSRKN